MSYHKEVAERRAFVDATMTAVYDELTTNSFIQQRLGETTTQELLQVAENYFVPDMQGIEIRASKARIESGQQAIIALHPHEFFTLGAEFAGFSSMQRIKAADYLRTLGLGEVEITDQVDEAEQALLLKREAEPKIRSLYDEDAHAILDTVTVKLNEIPGTDMLPFWVDSTGVVVLEYDPSSTEGSISTRVAHELRHVRQDNVPLTAVTEGANPAVDYCIDAEGDAYDVSGQYALGRDDSGVQLNIVDLQNLGWNYVYQRLGQMCPDNTVDRGPTLEHIKRRLEAGFRRAGDKREFLVGLLASVQDEWAAFEASW